MDGSRNTGAHTHNTTGVAGSHGVGHTTGTHSTGMTGHNNTTTAGPHPVSPFVFSEHDIH